MSSGISHTEFNISVAAETARRSTPHTFHAPTEQKEYLSAEWQGDRRRRSSATPGEGTTRRSPASIPTVRHLIFTLVPNRDLSWEVGDLRGRGEGRAADGERRALLIALTNRAENRGYRQSAGYSICNPNLLDAIFSSGSENRSSRERVESLLEIFSLFVGDDLTNRRDILTVYQQLLRKPRP